MMKTLALIIVYHISFFAVGQNTYSDDQLIEDLNYLKEKLVEIHPDPFANFSYSEFNMLYNQIVDEVKGRSLTKNDFTKLIMPVISKLNDGHTEVKVPHRDYAAFRNSEGLLFAFDILVRGDRIVVKGGNYDGYSLTSINNQDAKQVLKAIRTYISAETESFRDAVVVKQFKKYLWFEVGPITQIELSDEQSKIELSSKELSSISQLPPKSLERYTYNREEGFDWLVINDMEDKGDFKKMLKSFPTNGLAKNLIIDLRANGGGNSAIGDALIDYLYDSKYRQVERLEIKSSKSQKQYIRQNYLPVYVYPFLPFTFVNPVLRATFAGKNGKIHSIEFKEKSTRNSKASYENIFVLTSNYTFSSAAILANALQYYNIGQIVGEETGGVKTFFGDNIIVTLPNTGIRCSVSFKKFILPGADEYSTNETIRPDFKIQDIMSISAEEVMYKLKFQIDN